MKIISVPNTEPQLIEKSTIQPPVIVMAGIRGAVGKEGQSAAIEDITAIAGETISALKVVYLLEGNAYTLDPNDEQHIFLLAGISLNTANQGQPLKIKRLGKITDRFLNFNLGRVFLGQNGTITQQIPSDGYSVLLGTANAANTVLLNIDDPIKL